MALEITGGDPWVTFVMVIWMSGITSAFVDNIPLTTTMIPVIHSLNGDPTIAAPLVLKVVFNLVPYGGPSHWGLTWEAMGP